MIASLVFILGVVFGSFFNVVALSGQRLHQSGTVFSELFVPVPMPEPLGQVFQVRVEPLCCVHLATPLLNCSYVILILHL